MSVLVVDASAVLALLFSEPQATWVRDSLIAHAGPIRMSSVNLAEVLIKAEDRASGGMGRALELLTRGAIEIIAPDVEQARIAAEARLRWPLNLGDCFAYALAQVSDGAIMALDADFLRTDRAIVRPA